MNVNFFIFMWNILIGVELSTASRGLKGGKVKMVRISLLLEMRCDYFLMTMGLARTVNR